MPELKVCVQCGEHGVDLVLNEDLLCPKCVDLQKKLKDSKIAEKEYSDDLIKWVHGKSDPKRISAYEEIQKAYYEASKEEEKREKKNFDYIYSRYEKARKLEKEGEEDKALKIYLKLLDRIPQGTVYYERPCIILEKKHEYQKAIDICNIELKAVEDGRFGGNVDAVKNEALHRKERLIKKLEKNKK